MAPKGPEWATNLSPWSPTKAAEQRDIRRLYGPYIDRQRQDVERLRSLESEPVPADAAFAMMTGLSAEAAQKFARIQPRTLGQASRIPGVTPEDIQILWVHLVKRMPPPLPSPQAGRESPCGS